MRDLALPANDGDSPRSTGALPSHYPAPDGRQLRRRAELYAQLATEWALRENKAVYREVIEDQTEVVCRFRADGTLTFVNDIYCRVFGLARGELLGRTWRPFVHPDDMPVVQVCAMIFCAAFLTLVTLADVRGIVANPRLRHR